MAQPPAPGCARAASAAHNGNPTTVAVASSTTTARRTAAGRPASQDGAGSVAVTTVRNPRHPCSMIRLIHITGEPNDGGQAGAWR
ncbi:hypothetical protein Nm8I071_63000 [Nonomuraea sp. TT08I-71]|nr:hypothetical protein Nm8I071_63000 [Nonomuraea sp. TT08I-71]